LDTIELSFKEIEKKITNLFSGRANKIVEKKKSTVKLVEMEDTNFHFDSAVLLPAKDSDSSGSSEQQQITGLHVLATCYREAEKNPDQKIMIAGHTDTKGDKNYNVILSQERADNVLYALIGDRARWIKSSDAKHKVEDYKLILTWVAKEFSWNCNPGEVNDTLDSQTKDALAEFQKRYNNDFNKEIKVDGKIGPQTWGAIFDIYMLSLEKMLQTDSDGLKCLQSKLNFINQGRKNVGCGEYFPIEEPRKDDYRSSTNRRVEILFFEPKEEPLLPCHPKQDVCIHSKCDIYGKIEYKFVHIPVIIKPPGPKKFWPVNIKGKLFWNRTWDYNDETKPITAIKEFLPGAKVELYILTCTNKALSKSQTIFLSEDGEFKFNSVPECSEAALRILLEHSDGKIVVVKGKSNAVTESDFEIKKGKVIWHQLQLDSAKLDGKSKEVDFKEVEIKKPRFVDICDAYKSVWFGHEQIKKLADYDLPICQINYPEPTTSTSNASVQMNLLKDDLKDRDVILHEYGHFIGVNVLGGLDNPGYGYNDDATGQHGRDTKEHYESAWNEGHATFLSCAMSDDPHYHDGYDSNLNYHLDTDNTLIGPHSEGSIQEALWRIYKVHKTNFKDGFWKAFTDRSKRTVRTIFQFYDNWKDLGLKDLDKVKESFKKFNMEFGYNYLDGSDRFTAVASPHNFNKAKKEFKTIDELYNNFGTLGGGTLKDYNEEFYNRNKQFNPGSLASGSKIADPKVSVGKKYITPERFQIK
jgi:OmpA family/Putative peptidoglycan binding domain